MNTKILGFTATDNSHQKDIFIVSFNENNISENEKSPINFKFGIFGYKQNDTFDTNFKFTFINDGQSVTHQLNLNNIVANDESALQVGKNLHSSQFSFSFPLPIKEGIVKCEMTLKQNNKEIDNATTYFALKKL